MARSLIKVNIVSKGQSSSLLIIIFYIISYITYLSSSILDFFIENLRF